jgi:hypothetical protein
VSKATGKLITQLTILLPQPMDFFLDDVKAMARRVRRRPLGCRDPLGIRLQGAEPLDFGSDRRLPVEPGTTDSALCGDTSERDRLA